MGTAVSTFTWYRTTLPRTGNSRFPSVSTSIVAKGTPCAGALRLRVQLPVGTCRFSSSNQFTTIWSSVISPVGSCCSLTTRNPPSGATS